MTRSNLRRAVRQALWLGSLAATVAVPVAPVFAADDVQEVVITGSRIKRDDSFDAPVPLAVLDGKAIADSGNTVLGEAISNMPQSLNNTNNQNSSGTLFNAGQSRVDLRGLGSARTLVLLDGRRVLTGDFRTSAVDLNMIPSTMVDRIEAISGGASAVYGSEAIAGVVNIILRRNIDGAEVDAQYGMTGEGDGDEYKISATYGLTFADGRGSWMIGGEYGHVDPIWQIDRDWAFPGIRRNNNPGITSQPVVPASRSNTMPTATFQFVGGSNAVARSSSIGLNREAVYVNSSDCRSATVLATCQDSHLFYTAVYNVLQGELDRKSIRTYGEFEITDNFKAFADLSYTEVDGFAYFQPAFSSAPGGGTMPVVLRGDNAYLSGTGLLATQLRTQWQAALGTTAPLTRANTAQVGKFWTEFGRRDADAQRDSYRLVGGFEGGFDMFGRDFSWDFYGLYSRLEGSVVAFGVPNILRVQQATDAVFLNGQVVCNDAGARAAGCQPWDLIHGPSAAAVAWTNAQARTDGAASQTVFSANVSTSLFDLPAGPLGFALGGEYREEKSDQIQDPLSASGALFYNAIGRTQGQYHIREAYTEIVVPILKDIPVFHRWSVELAGRYGDYSSVGAVDQWRVQMTWAPIEDIFFRGSKSVAVRAPNIAELYAPQGRNFTTSAIDVCDRAEVGTNPVRIANCAAAIPGYNPATFVSNIGAGRPSLALLQGGNPDLFEESANTIAAGVVFKPRFLEHFQMSFDYWKVEVEDAVNLIPINTLIKDLCYDVAVPIASNRFCSLIRRDATGATTGSVIGGIAEVILTNQNVQALNTAGYDLAVQYAYDFGTAGIFQVRGDVTKVTRYDLVGIPGQPATNFKGILTGPIPEYKASATLGWTKGNLSLQWQTRAQSSYGVSETLAPSSRDPFDTGNYFEHDLRGTYKVTDDLTVRAGIINVTDENPPLVPEVGNATGSASSTYDNRGRFFYAGVNWAFGKSK